MEGGFTDDVALDGVLIRCKACPGVGSDVRVEVLLPSPIGGGPGLRIQCVGKVTRVVTEGDIKSFGVQGDFDDAHLIREVHK